MLFCSREIKKIYLNITTQQLDATAYNGRKIGLLVFVWR
jgi:hypothetical protein